MRKVVYIFSFGHSGSTLLSLILEQHTHIVSIGEIANYSRRMLNFSKERKCSCGKVVLDCPLWGDLYERRKENASSDLKGEYSLLLEGFSKTFSEETIMVDSSKVIGHLQQLQEFDDVDLSVIYLIKDIRSFLVSTKRKALKRGKKFGLLSSLKHAIIWYRENQYNLNYVEQHGIDHLKIGYEELCLYPQEANELLFGFLNLEPTNTSINIDGSQGHMLYGNRMRTNPKKNISIKYDSVWFTDTLINIIGVVLPKVAKFNRKTTYSNKFDQMWKK